MDASTHVLFEYHWCVFISTGAVYRANTVNSVKELIK